MTRSFPAVSLLVFMLVVSACTSAPPQPTTPSTEHVVPGSQPESAGTNQASPLAGIDPAPEFPQGLDWLNTATPLTMQDLRGKVVLLDFWTYGCINCIHNFADLKRLEAEYPDELVVVGVHSAKFLNEGSTENIRQVILRYELEHPVVNDRDFVVWSSWGATAWPTTVLVDPAGNIVGGHAGEGVYEVVKPVLEGLVAEFEQAGRLDRTPLQLALEKEKAPRTILSFPGKILADAWSGRLYVADSGHHRVVSVDLEGKVVAVYGSGVPGHKDGAGTSAQFHSPQGMALAADGKTLYVADTNNHAVRVIQLDSGVVTTGIGTGAKGWPPVGGVAPAVALNSPWDVTLRDETLYIANAGTHQIWRWRLTTGSVDPLIGSAAEGVFNGPFAQAELAQPSGLAFDDRGRLFFADSESSSIRYADFVAGSTAVLAGTDRNLFDFGDVDAVGTEARLQHPLGVAFWDGSLYIADTYNSKIKKVDLETANVVTLLGEEQGWADGNAPRFYEPGGLSAVDGRLYIADTNNHAIRVADLRSGETTTLVVKGIQDFAPAASSDDYRGSFLTLEAAQVAPGVGTLVLDLVLPLGYKVNDEAPSSVAWTAEGEVVELATNGPSSLTGTTFPVEFSAHFSEGSGSVTADINLIYCEADATSLCFLSQLRLTAPLTVAAAAPEQLVVRTDIPAPGI